MRALFEWLGFRYLRLRFAVEARPREEAVADCLVAELEAVPA